MEEESLNILRKYLKRRIAEKNLVFSGITYKYKEDSKRMRSAIFKNFARGKGSYFDSSVGNVNYKYICQDIQNNKRTVSPYNYFDLDTLIAYDKYLEYIIDELYNTREKAQRGYFLMGDFASVIDEKAPKFLSKFAGSKLSGYYNADATIKTLVDENGKIAYERTPDKKTFEKKYTKSQCADLLKEYLEIKHPEKNVVENGDSEDESLETMEFNDITFYIIDQKIYMNFEGFPIKYISAKGTKTNTILKGFFNMSGKVYHGDVYSTDGEFLYSKDESGVALFGDGATTKFDGMGRDR